MRQPFEDHRRRQHGPAIKDVRFQHRMRRPVQNALERDRQGAMAAANVEHAFRGYAVGPPRSLNGRRLRSGARTTTSTAPPGARTQFLDEIIRTRVQRNQADAFLLEDFLEGGR